MKIAIIHASDFGGGAERSVISLHESLIELGHESTLYVGEKQTETPGVVGIPYVRGIPGTRRLARWIERVTGWQDIYNPSFRNLRNLIAPDTDIIHFNSLWGSAGYADLSVLPILTRRTPGVITERQTWLLTGHCGCYHECMRWKIGCGQCPDLTIPPAVPRDGTRFNWRRKKRLVGRSNLVLVAISDWLKEQAEQSPIWQGKRIVRIHNGIDTQTFRPVARDERTEIRARLGIPEGRVAVLVTGQTLEGFRRGFAGEGFEAINRLSGHEVLPVLVGHSSAAAAQLLDRSSLQLPYQRAPEAMADCYRAADITLVTSRVESFGRIPVESLACGTPVVAFDSGALGEVVRNGLGSISIPNRNVAELTEALGMLVHRPELRRLYGIQGVQFVREHFEESAIATQYVSLYSEMAATHSSK